MNKLPIRLKFKIKILNKKARKHIFYYFRNDINIKRRNLI